jgi:alpha-glucosidase
MAAGPMDFTPGSMNNASEKDFAISFNRPMSMGTRAHQVAMYIVYESPLQMLCESPTEYYREKECTEYISKIPTVWDETKVLDAKIAEYIIVARRNGNKWYLGGMTNNTARNIEIDLSFLPEGSFEMITLGDGINSDMNAKDYKLSKTQITGKNKLKVGMASGGGWAAIITL